MNWIENAIAFLNKNSGTINLLFSLVVAISTVVYAWLTAKLVSETRILRRAQTEPLVTVSYRLRDDIINILDLNIENVGSGPAYDIEFNIIKLSNNQLTEKVVDDLEKISLLKKISYIAPSQIFNTTLINVYKYNDFDFDLKIMIEVSYKSSLGTVYNKKYTIDLSELKGFSRRGQPPLLAISNELRNISENLKTINYTLNFFKNRDYCDEVDPGYFENENKE